ncbi:MAG: alpha/beta fold hydrolase [Deltaproteobacteria bacterium]|nr:alpha/beta fold hydrolase [Deltaproteobacteria bacterium]
MRVDVPRAFRGSLWAVLPALLAAACSGRAAAPADPDAAEVLEDDGGVESPPPVLDEDPAWPSAPPDAGPGPGRVDDRVLEPPAALPGSERSTPEAVRFESSDGVVLHGSLWRTGDPAAPAVVFVHQARSDRTEWSAAIEEVRRLAPGLNVLALDLRGHGASTEVGERTLRWKELQSGDRSGLRRWASCTDDVQAAVAFLRGRVGGTVPRAIGLVGSSIGATSALRAAANDGVVGPGNIAAVVVLSPGMNYFSVPIEGAAETLKMRRTPVLAVGARDDSSDVAGTMERLQRILVEQLQVLLFEDGGHGVAVATLHPELVVTMVVFLKAKLGLL